MRFFAALLLVLACVAVGAAQDNFRTVYETERAFEKMVAEKGIREGFIAYLSPAGVMFMPDAVNARETWSKRDPSPASLTWNPVWIDVSANGALAYSIGNSQFRPRGKDDPQVYYGHYISIWMRQPNGEYRAALDTGINHEKPASEPRDWKKPNESGNSNEERISAADSAVPFYQLAQESGAGKAYRSFLADDAIVMRDGRLPAFDKKAGLKLIGSAHKINFAKRKSFTEAADLGYVHGPYNIVDKIGKELERGNFIQAWKLRDGKWKIVADVLVPLPAKAG